ncbi:hypothetical protein H8957_000038 [Semnopithecus entellus]|uniref:uncharacterized protein LOC117075312 isoform X2 n=1 Tax=Trachypithecus francoisi TaxID=54180 RepID=UPI00141B6E00|nr:uncharacterized protein LOC117075312 isoform X2 [Trachypithecus francoisi]
MESRRSRHRKCLYCPPHSLPVAAPLRPFPLRPGSADSASSKFVAALRSRACMGWQSWRACVSPPVWPGHVRCAEGLDLLHQVLKISASSCPSTLSTNISFTKLGGSVSLFTFLVLSLKLGLRDLVRNVSSGVSTGTTICHCLRSCVAAVRISVIQEDTGRGLCGSRLEPSMGIQGPFLCLSLFLLLLRSSLQQTSCDLEDGCHMLEETEGRNPDDFTELPKQFLTVYSGTLTK